MQLDPKQIWEGIRRRWWLALIVALTAAAVAYLYSNAQPSLYEAQATIAAEPVPPSPELIDAIQKTLPTYAAEIASKAFISQVVDDNHIADVDPGSVVVKTQARPSDNSIVMTVDHGDPQTAAQLAESLYNAFIEQQAAENQQVNANGNQVAWVITQAAEPPQQPFQPRPRLYAAAAGLFGLLLGLLLAVGLELLDTSLKTPADVQRYVGVNTVGIIPRGRD